jgi:hypothetical protein
VSSLPEYLDRNAHVDLHGRNIEPLFRRAGIFLLTVACALGLANVFGQHTHVRSVDAEAAKLTVETPGSARGGLIYQTVFRVDAHRYLPKPTLVLDPGWFDGLTINTVQPDSVTWGQREGRNTIELGPLRAGEHFVLRLQYQVNPTVLGHRTQNVVLADGETPLLTLEHAHTIFP